MQILNIEGKDILLNANFSLRWVEQADGPSYPVLYQNGKRIVKKWRLKLDFESPEDPFGGNANTN